MSDFRPDLDGRTCLACEEPVSERLRGYMDSLRACEQHLAEWKASFEGRHALLTALTTGEPMGHGPFEAWAAQVRATIQTREET